MKDNVYLSISNSLRLSKSKYTLKLNKALCGLKTSLHTWQNLLHNIIIALGFQATKERCVYVQKTIKKLIILLTYVENYNLFLRFLFPFLHLFFFLMKNLLSY